MAQRLTAFSFIAFVNIFHFSHYKPLVGQLGYLAVAQAGWGLLGIFLLSSKFLGGFIMGNQRGILTLITPFPSGSRNSGLFEQRESRKVELMVREELSSCLVRSPSPSPLTPRSSQPCAHHLVLAKFAVLNDRTSAHLLT